MKNRMFRRTNIVLISASISVISSGSIASDFVIGNNLYSWCTASPADMTSFCIAYIIGISDVLSQNTVNNYRACIPLTVNGQQERDIVVNHLHDHPETRHYGAAGLVAQALAEQFPCR